ncbi:enoyl-CoA hydratase/isomerase family protein [Gordonia terrae]
MGTDVLYEREGSIARVTLNRPHAGNALTPESIAQLLSILRSIERSDDVRVVVIDGNGKHFMAGADLADFQKSLDDPTIDPAIEFESRVVRDANQFPQILERMPQPVVAKVNGCAAGGGAGLALASDFIVFGESSSFLFAHSKVGLSPDNATGWLLTRAIGERMAKRILMFGERVDAEAAERWGLVDQVVPDVDLERATMDLARSLSELPRVAVKNIKKLVNGAARTPIAEQLQLEALWLAECAGHPDFREGVTAFQERRAPNFQ